MHHPAGLITTVAPDISTFRSAVDDSFVPLQVTTPARTGHFHGVIRGAGIDEVHLTDVRATAHTVERTPALIARADRSCFLQALDATVVRLRRAP